jgi:hypothetical protein
MNVKATTLAVAIALGAISAPALGYVGPGAGLTLLSALWGLLLAVGVAVGFVVLWPIRRWRRRRQAAALDHAQELDTEEGSDDAPARGWSDR